ncbi:MAG: nicotinamide mononucleotide transporter [Bacteroidia bacterium]|nr:nicotinamide mononucleotide transporter [Bacteroidia bacterium]
MDLQDIWELLVSDAMQWVVIGLNVLFVLFLIKENILGWLFGILASIFSLFLMYDAGLYSETLLYTVYVILGVYAWYSWGQHNSASGKRPIQVQKTPFHISAIAVGGVIWFALGFFFMRYTDSNLPWADAFSTSFAFVATYLEAKKVLHHWLYWIILNLFSIWLYEARDLTIMAWMMAGFTLFSIWGYIDWSRKFKQVRTKDHLIA